MAQEEITSAERIRELSAINAEIAHMLQSAGHAINALTDRPLSRDDEDDDTQMTDTQSTATSEERREAFSKHTKAFYTTEQSIVAKLRRQVYALEEAGITEKDASAQQAQVPAPLGQKPGMQSNAQQASRITNGGMGNLDIGWLNSKGNKVGAEKENELMQETKELLESELKS